MPRKKNPRRILLEQMRSMKRRLDRVIGSWDVAGTVYEPHTEIKKANPAYYPYLPVGPDGFVEVEISMGKWRKRAPEEYPENRRVEWAVACHALDAIIQEATLAREQAYQNWLALDPAISNK